MLLNLQRFQQHGILNSLFIVGFAPAFFKMVGSKYIIFRGQ
jgi:hypothetical protein